MAQKSAKTKVILSITSLLVHIFLNIIFYAVAIMLIINLSAKASQFSYRIFGTVTAEEAPGRDLKITIDKGESTMSIAKKLEDFSLIVDRYSFYIRVKLTEQKIIPGTYLINSSMDYDEILELITTVGIEEEKK